MAVTDHYRIHEIPGWSSRSLIHTSSQVLLTEQEESKLNSYFKNRSKRLQVVATTITPQGQILDWIQPATQSHEAGIASPPPPLIQDGRFLEKDQGDFLSFELETPDAELGPPGTVPVLRRGLTGLRLLKTLDEILIQENRRICKVWLKREGKAELSGRGDVSGKNFEFQIGEMHSGQVILHSTDLTSEFDHLRAGQICLISKSNYGIQSVEAGLVEQQVENHVKIAHLFTSYFTRGYTRTGDNLGGYNQDESGWVQFSNTIHPGALSVPICSHPQKTYVAQIQFQLYQENWWLAVNSNWIGYYPASLFKRDGLREKANLVAVFDRSISADFPLNTLPSRNNS